MIRVTYFWVINQVNKLFLKLLAVLFWSLMSPALAVAFVTYFTAAPFRDEMGRKVVASKISRWKWADAYTVAIEKLTGYKM